MHVENKDLDLNLLRVFSAVMRRRSTTLAGEELKMTQSAISNSLKRLRLHFADPLFVKTSKGMMPTLLAEKISIPLLKALGDINNTICSVSSFDPTRSERTFKVYMSDVGQLILVPRLLRELQNFSQQISISIVDIPSNIAHKLMIEGEIDIAIGTFSDFKNGFHSQRLFQKSYVVIGRKNHPELKKGLTLDGFLRARHAIYKPPANTHDELEAVISQLCRENGARRRVVVELAHSLGIYEVISNSDLLICVPSRLAKNLMAKGDIESGELPFSSPVVEVSQYWHERMHADEGHKWFRNLIYRSYSAL
jgi:DNA-binding transcriptional LysR family regulator